MAEIPPARITGLNILQSCSVRADHRKVLAIIQQLEWRAVNRSQN